ncbi:hypothetical protein C5167_000567, partial [Papaver somniferum]
TKMGDTIDCIDIYKQPAFDHPLLKNHKIQFVSVETPYTTWIYHGAIASFGIHTPSVTRDQYSTSQMWIQNGEEHATNSIEAGWAVYPELFNDNTTRIFSRWTADGYISTGCFNTMCPGFVQIHRQILFGAALNPLTPYGREVYFSVILDEKTKSWWFCIGNDEKTPIGYWPSEIFIYLPGASLIRFGGIAGRMPNTPSPPMGNGNLPTEDYKMESTGFMRFLQTVEADGDTRYFDNSAVTQKSTSADCYDIIFRKYGKWKRRKHGYNSMIFGGPGGNCL